MEIDVIIPLYKPGKELFTLLDKLGSQSVPVHQVILLNTEEKYFEQLIYGIRFLETYQNIKVYHVSKREFDHGGTRRMGVKKSSADVFVMMTQDAMPKDDRLIEKLVEPLQAAATSTHNDKKTDSKEETTHSPMYWGKSKVMQQLRALIEKVAITDANILITGENGTGKEMLAREIHVLSNRKYKEMIAVDMGTIMLL